jgi:ribosome-associated toxin RatA of RatAB toxin-antitoxin module
MPAGRDSRLTYVEVEVAASAELCFELISRVEGVPEWVPGVAIVHVLERTDDGKARLAEFVGMPSRGSFAYTLQYEYDPATLTVRWQATDRKLRELEGEAVMTSLGPDRCRVRYGLCASTSNLVPGWASTSLRDEAPAPIADAFKRWAERRGPR